MGKKNGVSPEPLQEEPGAEDPGDATRADGTGSHVKVASAATYEGEGASATPDVSPHATSTHN